jgi:hypothetical protein
MRTRDGAARGLAFALALSCASNPTPADRRVSQEEAISSGKGAYALVRYHDDGSEAGELIATNDGRILLLTDLGHLIEIDRRRVSELTLGVHDNNADAIALWGVLGTLSTISHGFLLIFSFPVWLTTSIGATSYESHHGLFHCPADTPETTRNPVSIRKPISMSACLSAAGVYARFPQGLPPGVGREQLLGRAPVIPPAPRVLAPDGGAPEAPVPYDQPTAAQPAGAQPADARPD